MKTFLILGAGTGGTMVANKMAAALDPQEWRIIIVDKDENHYYQPGFCSFPLAYTARKMWSNPNESFYPHCGGGLFRHRID